MDVRGLMLTEAPGSVAAWASLFDPEQFPILAATADAVDELAQHEEAVDAHLLADAIVDDPLMTLKLLSHVARMRRGREGGDTETVTEALVMIGIPPFFRAFSNYVVAEERLAEVPQALEGFRRVLRRSHRAARFAIGFAVHRMDHDAAVIHEAALLHDFTELLLWLHAPALALEIARRQAVDPTLRSAVVQRQILHIELSELQHELMSAWRLPSLLVQISDDHARATTPQVRNVRLAIRLARHSADGWGNPALPDDLREIGELLQLAPGPTARLVQDIDTD